jgi:leucyl-tRNA synthetase
MPPDSSKNERYNAREAEARWQKLWDARGIFATKNDDPRPKYYVLEMFPYPSGRIHMGHVRNYTMGDVVARFKRAMGFQRAAPDGLGRLRHAGGKRRHRAQGASQGVDLRQYRGDEEAAAVDGAVARLGARIATCDPSYYKHQQKMFLDFLRAGLVEREKSQGQLGSGRHTVLANEQVIDGRGWRSGAVVEQREMTQWFSRSPTIRRSCWTRSTRSTAGRTKSG